jgi:hypothetical protein
MSLTAIFPRAIREPAPNNGHDHLSQKVWTPTV